MNESEIILYRNDNGTVKVEIRFEDETFWLTQKKLAELFGVEVNTINYHIKEIYQSGELQENRTIRKNRIVQTEGSRQVNREVTFYNLDVIIAVGYRVNSYQATQFRIWATQLLKEYLIKGFAMDDDRLKEGKRLGKDYFDELVERIRSIRASERRFYQKITDIYAEASIDYDARSPMTQQFYKTVQNKMHWAITGLTAAEIIAKRIDPDKPSMGLTSWKNGPEGTIKKTDVQIAKNYLTELELKELESIVVMYLDYAENQAKRRIPMKMNDWITKLDAFLQFNEYEVLHNAGKVSAQVAKQLANDAYQQYKVIQENEYESDFDNTIKNLTDENTDGI